jgi:hypothetical protein
VRRQWNPCLIDEDPDTYELLEDGTKRRGIRMTLCDDDIEMIRQGYKCIDCGEVMRPQDEPFPAECFLCGFRMREFQSARFAEIFQGWRHTGSTIDWDEEQGRLEHDRFERERAEGLRAKGIWVPGD